MGSPVPREDEKQCKATTFFYCVRSQKDSCTVFYARIVPLLEIMLGLWVKPLAICGRLTGKLRENREKLSHETLRDMNFGTGKVEIP